MRRITLLIFIGLLVSCSSAKKETNANTVATENKTEAQTPVESETAESEEGALWSTYDAANLPDLERRIDPSSFDLYKCDYSLLMNTLKGENPSIEIPTKKGLITFKLVNSNTMNEALAAKYPEIKSYKGKSTDGTLSIRLDTNDKGLFVEVTGTEFKNLLNPILAGNKTYYALYTEDAITPSPRDKTFD
jgi:hypothetical protein